MPMKKINLEQAMQKLKTILGKDRDLEPVPEDENEEE